MRILSFISQQNSNWLTGEAAIKPTITTTTTVAATTAAAVATTTSVPDKDGTPLLLLQVENVTETFADISIYAGDGPGSQYMITLEKEGDFGFELQQIVPKQPFATVVRLQPLGPGKWFNLPLNF